MRARLFWAHWRFLAGLLCTLGMPCQALAQFSGTATALARFESNSNVFNLESDTLRGARGGQSDTYFSYGARFDTQYRLGLQELYATAATNEYVYQRFTQLDHNDYDLDAGLRWQLASPFSGRLDVSRQHTMVPFYDLGQTSISVQTQQRETAEAAWQVDSAWVLQGSALAQTTREPLLTSPDLQLREKSGSASLQYTGFTGWSTGLKATYSTGDYSGDQSVLDRDYRETSVEWVAKYAPSGRSSWDGALGYTRRSSLDSNDSQSGPTGHLTFSEDLTPKTSVHVGVSRAFVSFLATAGAETDTGGNVSVEWRATRKLDVNVAYVYTLRHYPGQGNDPPGSDRLDHQQAFSLLVNYQPLPRLSLRPYANLLKRTSDFLGGDFNSNIAGVNIEFTFGRANTAPARR